MAFTLYKWLFYFKLTSKIPYKCHLHGYRVVVGELEACKAVRFVLQIY